MSQQLQTGKELVLELLREKSAIKKEVCSVGNKLFADFKRVIGEMQKEYEGEISDFPNPVRFEVNDKGEFEIELTFAGDILYFTLHTNVFSFEPTHPIWQNPYIKEDETRAYCCMIQVHNFLYDSIKYSRQQDAGYLIGRIFINKDGHFFVEGKRQLGFLYNDMASLEMNDVYIRAIVESAMLYSIDFDLFVPPYDQVSVMSVMQKMTQQSVAATSTAKRMGFKFQYENNEAPSQSNDTPQA